ncbi:Hepatocyte growth factor-regulated tyrosine kinase substrate [Diplonema papillatum]|nr:Hepatocyte growth factor-regulated tyrosine kinase substrate [Diplonema papillatum]
MSFQDADPGGTDHGADSPKDVFADRGTGVAVDRAAWENAKQCQSCKRAFGITTRKHHCRSCGGIFCGTCTKHKEVLLYGSEAKELRVCNKCATNRAIDREEPLFKLLGPDLGPKHYYSLKRVGRGDLQQLCALSNAELEQTLATAGIPAPLRPEMLRKILSCRDQLSRGSVRDAMRVTDGVRIHSPAPGDSSAALFGGVGGASSGNLNETLTPKAASAAGSSVGDKKLLKKKAQDDIAQLEAERQRLQAQVQVADAAVAVQMQTLTRVKRVIADEEKKIGTMHELRAANLQLQSQLARIQRREADQQAAGVTATTEAANEATARQRLFAQGKHSLKACAICEKAYTVFAREHHCRQCYRSVCSLCSGKGKTADSRVCDWCKVTSVLSSQPWERETAVTRAFRLEQFKLARDAAQKLWSIEAPEDADAPTPQVKSSSPDFQTPAADTTPANVGRNPSGGHNNNKHGSPASNSSGTPPDLWKPPNF